MSPLMSEMPAQATLPPQRMEAAMWREGIVDWIVLGSGYLLALGLFAWLGGFACAATAIKRWGSLSTREDAAHRL